MHSQGVLANTCILSERIKKVWSPEVAALVPSAIVVLVGCEIDLIPDHDPANCISDQVVRWVVVDVPADLNPIHQALQCANDIGAAAYMECSTFKNIGVIEIFDKIAELCLATQYSDEHDKQPKQRKRIPTTLRVRAVVFNATWVSCAALKKLKLKKSGPVATRKNKKHSKTWSPKKNSKVGSLNV